MPRKRVKKEEVMEKEIVGQAILVSLKDRLKGTWGEDILGPKIDRMMKRSDETYDQWVDRLKQDYPNYKKFDTHEQKS